MVRIEDLDLRHDCYHGIPANALAWEKALRSTEWHLVNAAKLRWSQLLQTPNGYRSGSRSLARVASGSTARVVSNHT